MTGILSSKINIPEVGKLCIVREELIAKLQSDRHAKRHVSLICAPAGYGKTTLVMAYLASIKDKKAWFFIDEGDNDPISFISYLIAALRKADIPIGADVDFLAGDAGAKVNEPTPKFIVGGMLCNISPSIAAFIITGIIKGKEGVRDLKAMQN